MDRKEEKSCLQKVRYETKAGAEMAYKTYTKNMKRNYRGRKVNPDKHKQIPYKCDFCGGWHLARK